MHLVYYMAWLQACLWLLRHGGSCWMLNVAVLLAAWRHSQSRYPQILQCRLKIKILIYVC